ncbi:MAG TPA: DinB family protein [Longimicrobiaceae bacterium]
MSLTQKLIAELRREASSTRKVLERVPEDRLDWSPHPKSMSLGQLALHVARLPGGIAELLTPAEVEAPNVPLPAARSRQELLAALQHGVDHAAERFEEWGEGGLEETWKMRIDGRTAIESPRYEMIRSLMMNHIYHHRGQLTVYLRLLEVPLPPVYGPTADENPFG